MSAGMTDECLGYQYGTLDAKRVKFPIMAKEIAEVIWDLKTESPISPVSALAIAEKFVLSNTASRYELNKISLIHYSGKWLYVVSYIKSGQVIIGGTPVGINVPVYLSGKIPVHVMGWE
jgi:hypothetical protein